MATQPKLSKQDSKKIAADRKDYLGRPHTPKARKGPRNEQVALPKAKAPKAKSKAAKE